MNKTISLVLKIGKCFFIPLICILICCKFNVFSYFHIIPPDTQFETGIAFYIGCAEIITEYIIEKLKESYTKITCVFYTDTANKSISNHPVVICNNSPGFGAISCDIIIEGNFKKVRNCNLSMNIPDWITAQPFNLHNQVISCHANKIEWKFDRLLSSCSQNNGKAEYSGRIGFTRNDGDDSLSMNLSLELKNSKKINLISLNNNGFTIKNRS